MQQSLDSHIIKAPHHSNPSTPKSLRNTAHSNPRPSDQKPQAPMEATATRVYRVSGDVPVDDEVPMVTS